jgi:hypothetical protein
MVLFHKQQKPTPSRPAEKIGSQCLAPTSKLDYLLRCEQRCEMLKIGECLIRLLYHNLTQKAKPGSAGPSPSGGLPPLFHFITAPHPDLFGVLVSDQLQLSTAFFLQASDQLSVETAEPTVPTREESGFAERE